MTEITLKIPDTKVDFFIELFKKLGLEIKYRKQEIPKKHQSIVLERIANTNENDLLDWDNVKDDFDGI